MGYCINPKCINRENSDELQNCQSCGTALLICDRYRIIKPLRSPNPALSTDIFEVQDWGTGENEWGTVKVLKVLKSAHNSDLVRSFKQEARVLIWLAGNAGIPKVEPDGCFQVKVSHTSQKLFCLVMEKISGINLLDFLQKQHSTANFLLMKDASDRSIRPSRRDTAVLFPYKSATGFICQTVAIDWLRQLTEILHKIHKYNLVHRDIKPSNLMLQPDGKLVLIDFGAVAEAGINTTPAGSAGYAAPEQIAGKAEARSDFFAMGRTFVHLLTGIPPFELTNDGETGKINWRDRAVEINNFLADFLDDFLEELMEVQPEKRPASTEFILEKLKIFTAKIFVRSEDFSPQNKN